MCVELPSEQETVKGIFRNINNTRSVDCSDTGIRSVAEPPITLISPQAIKYPNSILQSNEESSSIS